MQGVGHHFGELIVQFFTLLAFTAGILLPAMWVSLRRLERLPVVARVSIGASVGFAMFVIAAWYLGKWSFDYILGFWIVQFPIAGWLGRTARSEQGLRAAERADSFGQPDRAVRVHGGRESRMVSWLILLPIGFAIIAQLYALHFSIVPPGVDASFHCVVAQRQFDSKKATTDLWPLEQLNLNYPIGSHLWVAVASRWTRLAIHEVFRHSFTISICGCLLVVGAWAERLFGTRLHAVAAAFALMFCWPHASLFPYTWGGLPSLMGVWLGLSGLFCVVHLSGSVGVILGAILLAGTAMVHHHTMLALWGAAAAIALIGMVIVTEHRVVWFRLLVALVCAACLAGIYILPLMRRIGDIKGTMVLNYTEHFDWPWEHFWSWYLVPTVFTLTLLSVSITTVSVWLGIRIRRSGVEPGSRAVLLGVGCLWLLSFCVLDYGCRVYGFIMNRPSVQPFTPSRFMFDVQFVLATIAAGGLVRFWEWLRRPAFRVAVATVIALSAVLQVAPRWQPKPDDLLVPLGKWADQNLPDDSLVISEPAATSIWITYLFHRESAALFIPISEHADIQRIRLKMAVQVQPALLPWSEWRRRLGKPLYLVGVAGEPKMVGPPIFTSRFFAIYDLNRLNNQDWKEGD